MNCPECGSKILQGHKYCSSCGYELTPEEWAAAVKKRKGGGGKKIALAVILIILVLGIAGSVLFTVMTGSFEDIRVFDRATPVPTAAPTAVPTAVPTAMPTASPTIVPTAAPTAVPTPVPTAVPTAVPTPTPQPMFGVYTQDDLYALILYMMDNGLSKVDLGAFSLNADQIQEVVFDFTGVERYWYRNEGTGLYFQIDWYPGMRILYALRNGTVHELDAKDQAIAVWAQNLVASLITNDMTDREKELVLHDYMIFNAGYEKKEEIGTGSVYGFYDHGLVQCAGYVDTFYLLGSLAGLEVANVSGDMHEGGGHAWNLVKLDGIWYGLDITHDDPTRTEYPYTSAGEAHTSGRETWRYFNIPHAHFSETRSWNPKTLPGGTYASYLDSNWYYGDVPVVSDLNTATQLAIQQLDMYGEALLIVNNPDLYSRTISSELANHYQCTMWRFPMVENDYVRLYRFSFTEN